MDELNEAALHMMAHAARQHGYMADACRPTQFGCRLSYHLWKGYSSRGFLITTPFHPDPPQILYIYGKSETRFILSPDDPDCHLVFQRWLKKHGD